MNPTTIYQEIKTCAAIIDTARQVLKGFNQIQRCTAAAHKFNEHYFRQIISLNAARIRHLQAELNLIALNWQLA